MTLLPHVTCIVWSNSWFRRYKRTSIVQEKMSLPDIQMRAPIVDFLCRRSFLAFSHNFMWGGLIWRVKMYNTRLEHLWKSGLNSGVVFFIVFTVLCCQYVCVILFCLCQWLYMSSVCQGRFYCQVSSISVGREVLLSSLFHFSR